MAQFDRKGNIPKMNHAPPSSGFSPWAPDLTQTILQNFIYALHPDNGTFQEIIFANWPNLIKFTADTLIRVRLVFTPKGKRPCRDRDIR